MGSRQLLACPLLVWHTRKVVVTAPSYSGLVRCPLTAVTPVRIRLGSRLPGCQSFTGIRVSFVKASIRCRVMRVVTFAHTPRKLSNHTSKITQTAGADLAQFQRWFLLFTLVWVVLLAIGGWWVFASYNANLAVETDRTAPWTSYPEDSTTWQLGFGGLFLNLAALVAALDVGVRLVTIVMWALKRRLNHSSPADAQ
jgi:hypothetical protein